jgi:hypothetical protein
VYFVQKGDDDDDESDSDGGSAADLVMLALVIQSSSGQPRGRLDFSTAAPLLFPLATGFCMRPLSISLPASTVLVAILSIASIVLFVLFPVLCRRCVAARRAFLASNASCAAAGERSALM